MEPAGAGEAGPGHFGGKCLNRRENAVGDACDAAGSPKRVYLDKCSAGNAENVRIACFSVRNATSGPRTTNTARNIPRPERTPVARNPAAARTALATTSAFQRTNEDHPGPARAPDRGPARRGGDEEIDHEPAAGAERGQAIALHAILGSGASLSKIG